MSREKREFAGVGIGVDFGNGKIKPPNIIEGVRKRVRETIGEIKKPLGSGW